MGNALTIYSWPGSRIKEPAPKNNPMGASTEGSVRSFQKIRRRAFAKLSAAAAGTRNAIRRIVVDAPVVLQTCDVPRDGIDMTPLFVAIIEPDGAMPVPDEFSRSMTREGTVLVGPQL